MSRIQAIVNRINTLIQENFYYKGGSYFGVCEQVTKGEEIIPAFFTGPGNYDQVGFDSNKFTVYHRITSIDETDDPELGFGNDSLITESYTLTMVVFGSQNQLGGLDSNLNYSIARQLKTLIPVRLNKTFLDTLEVKTLFISKGSVNTNKTSVFSTEMPNTDVKVNPDNILFSVEYVVNLTLLSSCLTEDCGTTFDLDCPPLAGPVTITNSQGGNIGTEPAGGTFPVPNSVGIDSDGVTPINVLATQSFVCTPTTPQGARDYSDPQLSGATTVFTTNDDGSNLAAGLYSRTPPVNPIHTTQLDDSSPFPFEVLKNDNTFNNKAVYTNLAGDYMDFGQNAGNYVDGDLKDKDGNPILVGNFAAAQSAYGTYTIDHFTGWAFDHSNTIVATNWTDLLLNKVVPYSSNGFSDYIVPHTGLLNTINYREISFWLSFLAIFSNGAGRAVSSTTRPNSTTQYIDLNNGSCSEGSTSKTSAVGFGTSNGVMLFRKHF